MSAKNLDADIIVAGGGLTGIAAAISAAQLGFKTVHLSPSTKKDSRTSALMNPSIRFLQQQGFVDDPDEIGTPLGKIRIIDATDRLVRAPETLFDSAEIDKDAFGWNFPNAVLGQTFAAQAAKLSTYQVMDDSLLVLKKVSDGFEIKTSGGKTISCKLIVGADGKKSSVRRQAAIGVRERQFAQSTLVCDLELTRPLNDTSIEFHYPQGPFTLVPAGDNRANLVWIDGGAKLNTIIDKSEAELAGLFKKQAQNLFGDIKLVTKPILFPLTSLTATTAGRAGAVLVGEAMHAFPPIGAQGLNLGLRDVADLIAALGNVDRKQSDWALTVSDTYAQSRAADLLRTSTMVDALFKSLLADMLPAQAMRAGGLWALRTIPKLRRQAFSLGMGDV